MNLADLPQADAPQTAGQGQGFTFYALRDLIPSPANVRSKDKRPPEAVMSMALSIAAHGGILQNLIVVPEVKDGQRTGRAEVGAGETRRQALVLLAKGGVPDVEGFTMDFLVPVREVESHEATASSATENIQRTPMHLADQFKAFAGLFDQCGSVEHVAAMFNVTPLLVQRRLKLAAAAPSLFELFRADKGMSLEQLMALCITDDHAAQERVWNAAAKGPEWGRSAHSLRKALTAQDVDAASPLARYVTVKAYEAAGGEVRRDLFADEDQGSLTNAGLLQQLAEAKLEKAAAAVRKEGWSWIEVRAAVVESHSLGEYTRAQQGMRTLTDDERAELDRLKADREEANAELDKLYEREAEDDESDELRSDIRTARERLDKATTALDKLQSSLKAWTAEVLGHAGAVVALDHYAKTVIYRGLVRPEDRKAATKAVAQAEASARRERAATASEEGGTGQEDEAAAGKVDKAALSESLTRRLTAQRTIALQRVLADNTQIALAALAHNMIQRLLDTSGYRGPISALEVIAKDCNHQMDAATESSIKESRAWKELQGLRDQWGERMPGDQNKLLPWLIALPMSELCDLLALCSALTVNALQGRHLNHPADALADAVGLDMADWWEPTASEYLSRVPKQMIAQALSEASMSADAASIEKLKKGEAVAKAEALLAGKRWVPSVLKAKAS